MANSVLYWAWQYNEKQHWKFTQYISGSKKTNYGAHNTSGRVLTVGSEKWQTCSVCGKKVQKQASYLVKTSSGNKIKSTTTGGSSGSSGGYSGGGGGGGSGGGSSGGSSGGGNPNAYIGYRDANASAVRNAIGTTVITGTNDFVSPPQIFYIYNKTSKETYKFDGVIKASHIMNLSLSEDIPEGEETKYVNGAKNERNKVTFDVIMSEVYTDRNDLTKRRQSRAESALVIMNTLKRERVLLDVVTNLMTYNNMLLTGIALTQDDQTTHYGFFGQLTFEEKPTPVNNSGGGGGGGGGGGSSATSQKGGSTSTGRTPSLLVSLLGANFI